MDTLSRTEFIKRSKDGRKLGWFVKVQGNLIEVRHLIELESWPASKTGRTVTTFSKQARMRMLKFVATINWEAIGDSSFVTLTYPDECHAPCNLERAIHRQRFFRDVERHLGKSVAIIWKTEWMPRKSGKWIGFMRPHYHLLLLAVPFIPHALIRDWWRVIIGANRYIATDIKRITGKLGAGKYLAKYISKSASLDNVPKDNKQEINGRMWGYTRRQLIPMCGVEVERQLSDEEVELAMQACEEIKGEYDRNTNNGFTLLGMARAKRFRHLLGLTLDEGLTECL
jgi:hypothetical protein